MQVKDIERVARYNRKLNEGKFICSLHKRAYKAVSNGKTGMYCTKLTDEVKLLCDRYAWSYSEAPKSLGTQCWWISFLGERYVLSER